jgi:hypothetical protein
MARSWSQEAIFKFTRGVANPARILKRVLHRVPGLPLQVRLDLDLYPRPAYAYGLSRAAAQAKSLGIRSITVVEFGVASGRGLIAMDQLSLDIEEHLGIRVTPVGFDTGKGLPEPRGYKDLPYAYQRGDFRMNEALLRPRLHRAQLVLGDVKDTVPSFLESLEYGPVGFISFDLDYYSSTQDAFALLGGDHSTHLPRVLCFFDDIANEEVMHSDYTGELLAIREFNEREQRTKISQVHGLSWARAIPAPWNDLMHACHYFEHPLYTQPVERAGGARRALGSRPA